MKILFICGCLEPGKDGVGDYTRRLGASLMRQGVKVGILAFQDYYIDNVSESNQESDGFHIPTLRLPTSLKNKVRCQSAKKWIELTNPTWLSLQFVPYSFGNKGLPFILVKQLKVIGGNRNWHIMFHELWLGLRHNDSFKFKVIGYIQKNIIKSLVRIIKFNVIHTHTKFYFKELHKLNLKPIYLPIFSNIPFIEKYSIQTNLDSSEIKFVHFGTIHPKVAVTDFANEMYDYFRNKSNLKPSIVLVGNSGVEQDLWVNEFNLKNIEVKVLGQLDSEEVSYILQDASFGITTNPIFVVEKSGTVAAMREHNLPILIVAENTKPKNYIKLDFNSDLFEYKFGNFKDFMEKKHGSLNVKGVNEISIQFLNDLKLINNQL